MLEKYINPRNDTRIYYAKEVTFDYGTQDEHRIDYVEFRPKSFSVSGIEQGMFYGYEIKSCIEDFKSGHGKNWYTCDMTYLVTLPEVYEHAKDTLPHWVGLMTPEYGELKVVKKAKPHPRNKGCSEMLLCMFRSANRENIRRKKDGNNGSDTADLMSD